MADQQLYLITGPTASPPLADAVAAALSGGVHWVQLRAKTMPAGEQLALASALGGLCRTHDAAFLVNDRVDIALAAGSHGVHLGERSLPPPVARRLLPPGALVGVSVHSLAGAEAAAAAGADYLMFGNVYPTASHPGRPGAGVDALAQIVAAVDMPVLAVGGITPANVLDVLATGCAGVAVISAILQAPDPARAAAAFREQMDAYPHPPRYAMPHIPNHDAVEEVYHDPHQLERQ